MTPDSMTLAEVNALRPEAFVGAFGSVYEHSPWVAQGALASRPFASVADMLAAFSRVVQGADVQRQLELVRAHPELGHRLGVDPQLSAESGREQGGAGLDRLSPHDYATLSGLNAAYREKFGMPFVICVRQATKDVIMQSIARRLECTPDEELHEALRQIDAIAALRLMDRVRQ